jgi:hypothetical protein
VKRLKRTAGIYASAVTVCHSVKFDLGPATIDNELKMLLEVPEGEAFSSHRRSFCCEIV